MKPHIGSIIRLQTTLSQVADKVSIKCPNIKIPDVFLAKVDDIAVGDAPFSLGTKQGVLFTPFERVFTYKTVVIAVVMLDIAVRQI